jgi:hypothetical protein
VVKEQEVNIDDEIGLLYEQVYGAYPWETEPINDDKDKS